MSSRPFSIRPATRADVPVIAAIYGDAVLHGTASFELDPPGEAEMARRMAALHDGGFPYLVADADGLVLGYAYAGPYRPRPAYRFTVEDSVYIAAEARGQGIGRALLSQLIGESESRGFRQMVAVIGDEASAGSIALHRALGFEHAGTLQAVGYKHGAWRATVLMQRALGSGNSLPPPEER